MQRGPIGPLCMSAQAPPQGSTFEAKWGGTVQSDLTDKANIDGIKAGRKKTLQSFGIETAADVTPANLAPVPGFGKVFSGTLLAWRAQKEKRFVFNENQQMDPKHAVQVEKEMLDKRIRLDKALNQSLAELSSASSKIAAERQRFELQAAEIELQQAKVDLAALTQ